MASEQSNHLAAVLGAAQDRLRNPDLGLPTVRDICEAVAALAKGSERGKSWCCHPNDES